MTDLLTPSELAVMLGMSVRTLANWRSTGKGPPYLKIGVEPPEGHQDRRKVRYQRAVAERWASAHEYRKDGGEMKKRHARSGSRFKSSPTVTSDVKARVDTGKPTLTQQGIDVDKFIRKNRRLIEKLRKGTR